MKTFVLAFVLLVSSFTITPGCGGSEEDNYQTAGDFILGVSEALCARAERCGQLNGWTIEQCEDYFYDAICNGEVGEGQPDCSQPIPASVSDEEIQTCLDDIEALACDAQEMPPSCMIH